VPISSFLSNLAILGALAVGYLLVLALIVYGVRWLRGREWHASEVVLSSAVGIGLFVLTTTAVDAIGAALRLDLAIGSMPPEHAQQLQFALRIGLLVVYVVIVIVGALASRPLAMRLGRVARLNFMVPLAIVLFIVLSLPITDLLHSCYLQTTVALASQC
jgi:uncharacterized membrane protein (DUF485 family)